MITWVTVWVLTAYSFESHRANYQLTYQTKAECEQVQKTIAKHHGVTTFCAWQKIPVAK